MIDWPALYRAVVDDLDSDEPRLVLADALQAAGDPRGELIAIQCELARLGCERTRLACGLGRVKWPAVDRDWMGDVFATGDFKHRRELRATEKRLLGQHVNSWTVGLPAGCRLERGFVEHVDAHLRQDPAGLFDLAPTLESLEFNLASSGAELIAEPRMQQVKQLKLTLSGSAPDRAALAGWASMLPRLRSFAPDDDSGDREFEWSFLPPVVERLEAVSLVQPAPGLVQRLCETAPRLRHLSLAAASTAGIEAAGDRLDILELEQVHLDVARAPLLPALRVLRLQELRERRKSSDGHRTGIARAIGGNLPALRLLDLSHTSFGENLKQLCNSGGLGALTHLRLRNCLITDEKIVPLLSSPLIHRLQHLDLRDNPITDLSIAGLSAASNLRVLELQHTQLSPSGVEVLRANLLDAHPRGTVFNLPPPPLPFLR